MTYDQQPTSVQKPAGKPYLRLPALAPDGAYLTFVYADDIWQVARIGGIAERLPIHYANYHSPRFSPDGRLLAFSSYRTGSGDIYVFPMEGGTIRQLTYHDSFCSVDDWSVDGQYIYFTSDREACLPGGEAIYRVSLDGGTPVCLFAEPYQNLEHVAVAPDGKTLACNTINGPWWRLGFNPFAPCKIWLIPLHQETKEEHADESHEAHEHVSPFSSLMPSPQKPFALGRWPMWAPDGMGIYFVADNAGVENIWYQALHDGEAQQVTHFTDGRVLWPAIARRANVMVFEREWQIWNLDLETSESAPIPIQVRVDTKIVPVRTINRTREFSELCLAPDAKKIAFVARGQIFADFADKEKDKELRQGPSFRVTHTSAREGQVSWAPDSSSIVYISDRYGETDLFRYDFKTRTETRLTNDPSTKLLPCCSPDGAWIAYFQGFDAIYLLNVETGETRPFVQGNFVRTKSMAWSPDSKWLAYISHDAHFFSNVYVQHIDEMEAHQITFLSHTSGYGLLWSPNGRFLLFNSGQNGNRVVRVDLCPQTPFLRETEFEKLFQDDEKEKEKQDKKRKTSTTNEETQEEQKTEPNQKKAPGADELLVTIGEAEEEQPKDEEDENQEGAQEAEDPETRKDKKKAVEPVEIVFDGIERRLSFLTSPQLHANVQAMSPDSRDMLFLASVAGKINIWSLPLDEPRKDAPPQQLTSSNTSKRYVQFAPNGKTFYYLDDGLITIRKFPAGNDPVTVHTRAELTVDFEREKLQVFGEAWRLLRDTFYDPTFRGQDWNAIRERFAPLAAGAQTQGDLTIILNLMVGELRTSHLGASWRSGGRSSDGYTGLLFDAEQHIHHGHLCVAGMVPDSPVALLKEPPKPGEYLVAIDDTLITRHTNIDMLLQRTVGRRVVLRLAPTPDATETRELVIRPIDEQSYATLRYQAWVATNEAYVDAISNGRLGYLHIKEMSYQAYQQFLVDLDVETHSKEGVVLDIRYNRGGYIATSIMDVLTRRSVLVRGFRDCLSTDAYHHAGSQALHKPTVLVTNERSASNAEIFTEMYRRLGLGKVVGKPTPGEVIGTIDRTLLNGIVFRLPHYSASTPEGEDLEGTGRAVDVEVDQPLGAWAHGHDYQLDAAVATLLESLGAC